MLDNQSLGRSCVTFPGSHAVRLHDILAMERSHVLGVTQLELGLGAVVKQLVIIRWVLGSFGNVFLVGTSFTYDMCYKLS